MTEPCWLASPGCSIMELVVPRSALVIADVAKAAHEPAVDAWPRTGGAVRAAAGRVVLRRGAPAGVRGGLLRITRRNAGVRRGSEERVLRRVRGEPRRPRLRVGESLSGVADAVPVVAGPGRGLPVPDEPGREAGSPVTNDPGYAGWAVASWLLTAGGQPPGGWPRMFWPWGTGPGSCRAGCPATGSAAGPAGDSGGADDGGGHVPGLCRGV